VNISDAKQPAQRGRAGAAGGPAAGAPHGPAFRRLPPQAPRFPAVVAALQRCRWGDGSVRGGARS